MNEHYIENVFGQITVRYEDKIVRVTCDDALMGYLELPGNGSGSVGRTYSGFL